MIPKFEKAIFSPLGKKIFLQLGATRCRMMILACATIVMMMPLASEGELQSNVQITKHNLSNSGTGTIKAESEDELCVFCHTPHGATTRNLSPLWNRAINTGVYTRYQSSSIQADMTNQKGLPGGTSKLCLSCHDGLLAVGAVNVFNGQQGGEIRMTVGGFYTSAAKMASGSGIGTGFTRNLDVNMSNDHPISFTYDAALATGAGGDGELREPPFSNTSPAALIVGKPSDGKAKLPLDAQGNIQCATCHDPHLADPTASISIKFLRQNRLQTGAPSGQAYLPGRDIICLACHDKGKANWANSAHAKPEIANELYKSGTGSDGELREFTSASKSNTAVWEAACLNCHDTHTVSGARRLLREGTNTTGGQGIAKPGGGKSAIEETCYQCHSDSATTILNTSSGIYDVPNIKTDFTGSNKRMPITNADQNNIVDEAHDIINANFEEYDSSLGKGPSNVANRHAECPDCHNPHRVMKAPLFNATITTAGSSPTHTHMDSNQPSMHSNLISGVLRGSWGVEPSYGNGTAWLQKPSTYYVKKGDNITELRTDDHVTREYQICLKCHSDYSYNDDDTYPDSATRPTLGWFANGTPVNTNSLTDYTNQAMEFAAAANETGTGDDQQERDAQSGKPWPNHRSWHPVMWPTGRTLAQRGGAAFDLWKAPWNRSSGADIGYLTMYCTDCHGQSTPAGTVVPSGNNPWGPHGSSNNFILKGPWNSSTGATVKDPSNETTQVTSNDLCFKCHNPKEYATDISSNAVQSGFRCGKGDATGDFANCHGLHAKRISKTKCTNCHVAIPHGWKNKAFLVNLRAVGLEAGLAPEQAITGDFSKYTQGPYYLNAALRILNWKKSGQWSENNCGSSTSSNSYYGINWMKSTCASN